MCTTGALRLGPEEYLLFKNKDFGRSHFDDRLVLDADVFGVEGITTWAGDDPDLDEFSGFSVGANRHGLLCCDSNVQTSEGLVNYDRAVEIALRSGTDVDSGVAAVREAARAAPFMRGNLVLIDGAKTASVELTGDTITVVEGMSRMARTNHHVVSGTQGADEDRATTAHRLRSALDCVATATSMEEIFALQRSHDDGDTGVCNHSRYDTVYSYVLHHRAGVTTLHVTQGRPCGDHPRHEMRLPLGDAWTDEAGASFREAYPSALALLA